MRTTPSRLAYGLALCFLSLVINAEEGGSGHYFPGSMSSFIDGVPADETLIARLNLLAYDGEFDSDVAVPIAGLAALDVEVRSKAVGLTGLWRPSVDLGDRWSYAAAVTVPFIELDVEAYVGSPNDPLGRTIRRSDSASGLGDVLFLPVMVNYNVNSALNLNFRLGVYAPTGDYKAGRLANQGKNFWTVEPTVAMIYLNPETGREFSAFLGADFNQENDDTDYKTGTQMHLELTASQHFPLGQGLGGVGVSGYWYQQVEGDSGDGAIFGSFKARSLGVGPVVSWAGKTFGEDAVVEFKWLHESGVKRRAEGDTLFLKAVLKF